MNQRPQAPPAAVPRAPQAGQIEEDAALRARWSWVEAAVWNVRMLTALEAGVKGGKWFRLFDKVFAERNLLAAYARVARNGGAPGVDRVTTERFGRRLPEEIRELAAQIQAGTYQPGAIRRVHIPKPGTNETRPLGIPTVRDRVVQAAVVNVIEPIFERDFAAQSHGFRPGRGCKDALRRVDELLKAGYVHVVDADLKGYFDSIPHQRLMARLREKISDGSVLRLIESFLRTDIMDGAARWTPEAGAPQGAVLSPLLSNVYLDPLDHRVAQAGYQVVRYADDFVILCRTPEEAQAALELVREWSAENELTLHPTKTKIVDARSEGFDFLGYHFRGAKHWVRDKSIQKLKDTIRAKTRKTSGDSLKFIIADVNRSLVGWFGYFQHSRPFVFVQLDGWIRQRLRTILRKRTKRKGRAKRLDNHRWPNAFFQGQGLFSLVAASASVRQSSRR